MFQWFALVVTTGVPGVEMPKTMDTIAMEVSTIAVFHPLGGCILSTNQIDWLLNENRHNGVQGRSFNA